MDKNSVIQKSFSINIKTLSLFGLYPPDQPSVYYTVRSYFFYVFFMVLIVIFTFIKLLVTRNPDVPDQNFMLLFVIESGFYSLKLSQFVINGHKVKKCVNYFGHRRFAPKNDEEKEMIEDCVGVCRKTCQMFFYVIMVSMVLWIIPKLITRNGELPVNIWLPFDVQSSPWVYYSVFTFLTIANFYDGVSGSVADSLIGTLSYHATTQLKILKHNLKNLDKVVSNEKNSSYKIISFESVCETLRQCVDRHNDILEFVAEYEDCFSMCVFCQVAGSTFSLCICSYGLTIASTNIDILKSLTYYFLLMSQILFYCFFGTLLYEENNNFMDAICEGPWFKYDPKIRKILIKMMERSKRPLIITAGKIFDLTLMTYTSILKTSYSLFAVLKKIH